MNRKSGFEARHLARCMKKLRDGIFSKEIMKKYRARLETERRYLIEELNIWCSYLNKNTPIFSDIPVLSIEESKKRTYLSGYTEKDFHLCGMLKIFRENLQLPPPFPGEVHIFIMLLQASINDLSWAIGELNAHLAEK